MGHFYEMRLRLDWAQHPQNALAHRFNTTNRVLIEKHPHTQTHSKDVRLLDTFDNIFHLPIN